MVSNRRDRLDVCISQLRVRYEDVQSNAWEQVLQRLLGKEDIEGALK